MSKTIITTPFDRYREPPKQNPALLLFTWLLSRLATRGGHLKIYRERMAGLKPPYLVLGTHHSFLDFYITHLALFPHRANYVSELEGFEDFGEWLFRQAGCLGTRKFVNDIALVKNIRRVVSRGGILVLYPEARYANVGTSSALPESVGKLAKRLDVPVVIVNMRGNYLQSPIWNLRKRKGARLETTITQLFTREELRAATVPEISRGVGKALAYDEYTWQYDRRIRIDDPWRAEGLELVLYQCPDCGVEFSIRTEGAELFCGNCDARWRMTELGRLESIGGNGREGLFFPHIPDWYEWQREQVIREIDRDCYLLDTRVCIESLPNARNFIGLGEGRLVHSREGFFLTLRDFGEEAEKTLRFAPSTMFSIHTEYDYRGKGQCVSLSTPDNTYFLYPLKKGFNVTRIQFAAEYIHQLQRT